MGLGLVFRVSNAVADPGTDGRGCERGVWGACPQVYLELVIDEES